MIIHPQFQYWSQRFISKEYDHLNVGQEATDDERHTLLKYCGELMSIMILSQCMITAQKRVHNGQTIYFFWKKTFDRVFPNELHVEHKFRRELPVVAVTGKMLLLPDEFRAIAKRAVRSMLKRVIREDDPFLRTTMEDLMRAAFPNRGITDITLMDWMTQIFNYTDGHKKKKHEATRIARFNEQAMSGEYEEKVRLAARRAPTKLRYDLSVPYSQKEAAKALGARWNGNNWYIDNPANLDLFMHWSPIINTYK